MILNQNRIIKDFLKTERQKWLTFEEKKCKNYEVGSRIEESWGGASDSMPNASSGAKN